MAYKSNQQNQNSERCLKAESKDLVSAGQQMLLSAVCIASRLGKYAGITIKIIHISLLTMACLIRTSAAQVSLSGYSTDNVSQQAGLSMHEGGCKADMSLAHNARSFAGRAMQPLVVVGFDWIAQACLPSPALVAHLSHCVDFLVH